MRTGVVVLVSDEINREITVEWRLANAEQIGQNMAELRSRPEYGGRMAVCDMDESVRVLASQTAMREQKEAKLEKQRADEALDQLKKLHPEVACHNRHVLCCFS